MNVLTPDRIGIGGFTEAVMAMMVVTVAVMLLSLSLAFGVVDVSSREEEIVLGEQAAQLSTVFHDDVLLWRGDDLVWSGLDKRSLQPYGMPVGCHGYVIGVDDLMDGSEWTLACGNLTGREVSVMTDRTPITILTTTGMIDAGLLTIEVW